MAYYGRGSQCFIGVQQVGVIAYFTEQIDGVMDLQIAEHCHRPAADRGMRAPV